MSLFCLSILAIALLMGLVVAVKGYANTLAYHATIINFFGEHCVFCIWLSKGGMEIISYLTL